MGNILTIEFKTCPASQHAVYQVRYRRKETDSYIVYPGLFTTSPALLSFPNDQTTQTYEGYVDAICGGFAGPSSYWQTGVIQGHSKPAGISLLVPAGAALSDNTWFRTAPGMRQASIDFGDGSPVRIVEGRVDADNIFYLGHEFIGPLAAHMVVLSFENDTDLMELWSDGDIIDEVSGIGSHKAITTVGFKDAGFTKFDEVPASIKRLDLSQNDFTSNVVNGVLASLVSGQQIGGSLQISNQSVSGGAPPTDQGVLDAATLIERGWFVETDIDYSPGVIKKAWE